MLKALLESLSLLALLLVLVGTASTDAYYGAFGLRYQLLDLSADHTLYRGLTAPMNDPFVAGIAVVALLCVAGQGALASRPVLRRRMRITNLGLVVVLAIAAWKSGHGYGIRAATVDRAAESLLPKIVTLRLSGQDMATIASASEGYRLLVQSRQGVYIFREIASDSVEAAVIRFFSGGQIVELEICQIC